MSTDYETELKKLLRELFQFDNADLDFGIYRILNHKRDAIEKFIEEELIAAVDKNFAEYSEAQKTNAANQLDDLTKKVVETLGEEALDSSGAIIDKYVDSPVAKEYLAKLELLKALEMTDQQKAEVFSHIYQFFSRYYQDGDFISKRRYSGNNKYAIPYNGEEVYLYWANNDQYYVKTSEYFQDYNFSSSGVSVHFKLKAADIEKDNVQGDKRFFIPILEGMEWDDENKELTIPFEYRPLTEQEADECGKSKQQETIIADALTRVPKQLKNENEALVALMAERRKAKDSTPVSYLEHHLRQYTKSNTSDFFIHKDLKGFLSRELDFYLKNEVLMLDDFETASERRSVDWFRIMSTVRNISMRIIDFLDQIENFQKMLWEKKKFVTETQYCITVGNIDESFYPEIADCEPQWLEWKEIFHIDENEPVNLFSTGKDKKEERLVYLKTHPTLVLDTQYFDQDFVNLVLDSFNDLDEFVDGLLVHGENFQALALLADRNQKQFNCIYIDPPYNAKTTEILYKNNYKHSSWLSLMYDRLYLSRILLVDDFVFVAAIDECEQEIFGQIISQIFQNNKKVCVSIVHNPRGQQGKNVSYTHDFAYFVYPNDENKYISEVKRNEIDSRNLRDSGTESDRTDAKTCFYPFIVRDNQIIEIGEVPKDEFHPSDSNVNSGNGTIEIWPIDESGAEKKWRYSIKTVPSILDKLEVKQGRSSLQIIFNKDTSVMRTVWADPKYDASEYGTKVLQDIVGIDGAALFSYPKSVYTVRECIYAALNGNPKGTVLDYFAGSGTTAHSVISLNREDGGNRKFTMIEIGKYFDDVLLPRVKKISFSPEWQEGKPRRMATEEEAENSPRIIKYIRIESYEDALDNIELTEPSGQAELEFDDYMLKYMLDWETRDSATLLNVDQLASPFDYKLVVTQGGETKKKNVDIPETFNYLLGLHVLRVMAVTENKTYYKVIYGKKDEKPVVVIWRNTEGLDLEADKNFIEQAVLKDHEKATVYINGDSFVEGAESIEPHFKKLMGT